MGPRSGQNVDAASIVQNLVASIELNLNQRQGTSAKGGGRHLSDSAKGSAQSMHEKGKHHSNTAAVSSPPSPPQSSTQSNLSAIMLDNALTTGRGRRAAGDRPHVGKSASGYEQAKQRSVDGSPPRSSNLRAKKHSIDGSNATGNKRSSSSDSATVGAAGYERPHVGKSGSGSRGVQQRRGDGSPARRRSLRSSSRSSSSSSDSNSSGTEPEFSSRSRSSSVSSIGNTSTRSGSRRGDNTWGKWKGGSGSASRDSGGRDHRRRSSSRDRNRDSWGSRSSRDHDRGRHDDRTSSYYAKERARNDRSRERRAHGSHGQPDVKRSASRSSGGAPRSSGSSQGGKAVQSTVNWPDQKGRRSRDRSSSYSEKDHRGGSTGRDGATRSGCGNGGFKDYQSTPIDAYGRRGSGGNERARSRSRERRSGERGYNKQSTFERDINQDVAHARRRSAEGNKDREDRHRGNASSRRICDTPPSRSSAGGRYGESPSSRSGSSARANRSPGSHEARRTPTKVALGPISGGTPTSSVGGERGRNGVENEPPPLAGNTLSSAYEHLPMPTSSLEFHGMGGDHDDFFLEDTSDPFMHGADSTNAHEASPIRPTAASSTSATTAAAGTTASVTSTGTRFDSAARLPDLSCPSSFSSSSSSILSSRMSRASSDRTGACTARLPSAGEIPKKGAEKVPVAEGVPQPIVAADPDASTVASATATTHKVGKEGTANRKGDEHETTVSAAPPLPLLSTSAEPPLQAETAAAATAPAAEPGETLRSPLQSLRPRRAGAVLDPRRRSLRGVRNGTRGEDEGVTDATNGGSQGAEQNRRQDVQDDVTTARTGAEFPAGTSTGDISTDVDTDLAAVPQARVRDNVEESVPSTGKSQSIAAPNQEAIGATAHEPVADIAKDSSNAGPKRDVSKEERSEDITKTPKRSSRRAASAEAEAAEVVAQEPQEKRQESEVTKEAGVEVDDVGREGVAKGSDEEEDGEEGQEGDVEATASKRKRKSVGARIYAEGTFVVLNIPTEGKALRPRPPYPIQLEDLFNKTVRGRPAHVNCSIRGCATLDLFRMSLGLVVSLILFRCFRGCLRLLGCFGAILIVKGWILHGCSLPSTGQQVGSCKCLIIDGVISVFPVLFSM